MNGKNKAFFTEVGFFWLVGMGLCPFSFGLYSPYELKMIGQSTHLCYGNNGILLVGKQTDGTSGCCIYPSSGGMGTPGQNSNSVPCPYNQIVTDMTTQTSKTSYAVGATAKAILNLVSAVQSENSASPSPTSIVYVGVPGTAPTGNAATEGDTVPNPAVNQSGGGEGGGGGLNFLSGGAGGGVGGGGGDSSGNNDGSGTNGGPTPDSSSTISLDSNGALYSSGGRFGSGGRGDFSGVLGEGGKTHTLDFGNGGSSGSGGAQGNGGGDGDEDSIFKIVHRRYQIKAKEWISSTRSTGGLQ